MKNYIYVDRLQKTDPRTFKEKLVGEFFLAEEFVKIGSTCNPGRKRGYGVYELVEEPYLILASKKVETKLLKSFEEFKYVPANKFPGYTECFSSNILENISLKSFA